MATELCLESAWLVCCEGECVALMSYSLRGHRESSEQAEQTAC